MTPAQVLGDFAAGLRWENVPEAVRINTKLRILDILGIMIAAVDEPGPIAMAKVVWGWAGKAESTIVGSVHRVPASNAALVNGTAAHSLDFDDTHHESRTHPSAAAVAAGLALGEAMGLSGRDVLVGIAIGIELTARIGLGSAGRFHERGFHATSVCGTLGVAAAAGRLLGLAGAEVGQAVGIAGSMASGLRESYLGQGTHTKALHAGWAAHGGILAALLAAEGFTGPTSVLEGRFGFYRAYVSPDPVDLERVTAGLGVEWEIPRTVFKLFPCGSLIHASIAAALRLMAEERLQPQDVAEVICVVPPGMVSTVCEPVEQKLHPQSGYQAKFSLQYAVSAALMDGAVNQRTYADERARDPQLQALLENVRYETDPSMPFPAKYPGRVKVVTRDGRCLDRHVANSPGSLEYPATSEDIITKFHGNVGDRLGDGRKGEIVSRVMDLEQEPDLKPLMQATQVLDAGGVV